MPTTIRLEPSPQCPERRLVFTRESKDGPLIGHMEVQEVQAKGTKATRLSFVESHDKPQTPGDRIFNIQRSGILGYERVCLPADPREFATCSCVRWLEEAWCLHVECLRALQAENLLRRGKS